MRSSIYALLLLAVAVTAWFRLARPTSDATDREPTRSGAVAEIGPRNRAERGALNEARPGFVSPTDSTEPVDPDTQISDAVAPLESIDQIQAAFDSEPRDTSWAPASEGVLHDWVSQIEGGGIALATYRVECKTTLCAVTLVPPGRASPQVFPSHFRNLVGPNPAKLMQFTDLKVVGYSGAENAGGLPEYIVFIVNSEASPKISYRLTSAGGEVHAQ